MAKHITSGTTCELMFTFLSATTHTQCSCVPMSKTNQGTSLFYDLYSLTYIFQCGIDILILHKCKYGWYESKLASLSSQTSFQLCYPRILENDEENSIVMYNDKEQGGNGFQSSLCLFVCLFCFLHKLRIQLQERNQKHNHLGRTNATRGETKFDVPPWQTTWGTIHSNLVLYYWDPRGNKMG